MIAIAATAPITAPTINTWGGLGSGAEVEVGVVCDVDVLLVFVLDCVLATVLIVACCDVEAAVIVDKDVAE